MTTKLRLLKGGKTDEGPSKKRSALDLVTAAEVLLLLAAPYESPARVGDGEELSVAELEDRGLVERDPLTPDWYRRTEQGDELARMFETYASRKTPPRTFTLTPEDAAFLHKIASSCQVGPECNGDCTAGWDEGFVGVDKGRAGRLARKGFLNTASGVFSGNTAYHVSLAGRRYLSRKRGS